jgi:hypothetical protein
MSGMLAALHLLSMAFSGGESEPERDLTEASYGARNWLVSFANTLKEENKIITVPNCHLRNRQYYLQTPINILYPIYYIFH